jgi:hypothetical protein
MSTPTSPPPTYSPVYPISPSILCNGDSLASITTYQTYYFSTSHQLLLSLDARGRSNRIYQYVLFTPPLTDIYFVRVPSTLADAVLEIRTGGCHSNYSSIVNSNDDLNDIFSTGFDSQVLENGVDYIILLGLYFGNNIGNGTMLEVGTTSANYKLGFGIGIP